MADRDRQVRLPVAALIVVDAQVGFDDPSWGRRNNPACDENIADLVDTLPAVDTSSTSATTPAKRAARSVRPTRATP